MSASLASSLADVSLVAGPLPVAVDAVAAVLLLVAVLIRSRVHWLAITAAAAGVGAATGLALCWILSDRLDLFDVDLSPVSRGWIAAGFAGAGAAVSAIVRGPGLRRGVAAVATIASLLVGAIGVNADFGQYTTVGSLGGQAAAAALPASVLADQRADAPGGTTLAQDAAEDLRDSSAPSDQPRRGLLGTVEIPATHSGVAARPAYVYLPPRALIAHPPRLPVLLLLSGQPGGPDIMARSGRVDAIADAYADAHHGLAPIIVIPDQLSAPQVNPMCVDSPLGHSATYLVQDVPDWILSHLSVEPRVGAWGIGGFSQGGTCTIQLGAGHPELFGTLLDISGQVAPANGSLTQTIVRGFGGSQAAYRAALPETLLAAGAPYRDSVAVFASGALDAKYGPGLTEIADAARRAGMRVTRLESPGTAHDWATVRWSLARGLPTVAAHLGLQAAP